MLFHNTDDSMIYKNKIKDNGSDGISLFFGSTGTEVRKNIVKGNSGFDLRHDGSSVTSTWIKNICDTKLGAAIPPC
jgi:parallel beta-helix repeat protein